MKYLAAKSETCQMLSQGSSSHEYVTDDQWRIQYN